MSYLNFFIHQITNEYSEMDLIEEEPYSSKFQINSNSYSFKNDEKNPPRYEDLLTENNHNNHQFEEIKIFNTENNLIKDTCFQTLSPKEDKIDKNNLKKTSVETSNNEITNNLKYKYVKRRIKKKFRKKIFKRINIKNNPKRIKRNRKKNIPKRKYNTDNIRKKIIAKFFKYLIKDINTNLGLLGIKKKFRFLPSKFINKFISEVLNEKDKSKLDFTFGQLISKNIFGFKGKEKLYKYNLEVLNKLRLSKLNNSDLNFIEKKKISQLFLKYLKSGEFNDGKMDKNENEQNYINKCKKKAYEFLNFFYKYYENKEKVII